LKLASGSKIFFLTHFPIAKVFDSRGKFWTCSLLGKGKYYQKNLIPQKNIQLLPQLFGSVWLEEWKSRKIENGERMKK